MIRSRTNGGQTPPLCVAITGGVAEGKSTVLSILSQAGYTTASSDDIVRELLMQPQVAAEVAALSGLASLADRAAYREALLSSPERRRAVSAYLHPLVLERILSIAADFTEVPLLIEAGLWPHFQFTWVVTCGPVEQRRRLVERLGDETAADRFLAAQLPTTMKQAFADEIIRTNEPEVRVHTYTLELASKTKASCLARSDK